MPNRIVVFSLLVLLSIPSPVRAGEGIGEQAASVPPAKGLFQFEHDGRTRSYFLYLPSAASRSQPLPLLLALHGGGGSAKRWPAYTNGCFERLAETQPFLLVYPEGVQGHWNDERDYPSSYAHRNEIDDLGFLTALIDYLVTAYPVDRNRVYVAGVSNGGMMTHYLAGRASERIAAIATVIASLPEKFSGRLRPSAPVSVLMINGTKDPLVPWDGGMVKFGRRENGKVLSVDETVRFWVEQNRCDTDPGVIELPDLDPSDGTRVSKTTYGAGARHTEVVLYSVFEGGHTWPSHERKSGLLRKLLIDPLVGRQSGDIDACEVIWDFFKSHPRQ
ncbi:MAG: PHB depolymerase family esterase [Candidatus Thiodiazotropha sp.]